LVIRNLGLLRTKNIKF